MKFLMQFVIAFLLDEALSLTMILLRPFLWLCMVWLILKGGGYFI